MGLAAIVDRHLSAFSPILLISNALIDNILKRVTSPDVGTLLAVLRIDQIPIL